MIPPTSKALHQGEMFRISLINPCRMDNPPVQLAEQNPRDSFEHWFGDCIARIMVVPVFGFE